MRPHADPTHIAVWKFTSRFVTFGRNQWVLSVQGIGLPARQVKLLAAGFLLALLSSFGQSLFIALFGGQIRADLG